MHVSMASVPRDSRAFFVGLSRSRGSRESRSRATRSFSAFGRLNVLAMMFTSNHDQFVEPLAFLASVGAVDEPRDERREQRREEARQRGVVKRALKAGLPVTGATVDGVELRLGATAAAPAPGAALDKWLVKHPDYAHPAKRH